MSELRPGWNRPKPDDTPSSTIWPAGLALGTMFFAWGLIASPFVLLVGLVVFVVSLRGWVGEARHDR
jgi:hypothetical protein